jgi:hypothetical protein
MFPESAWINKLNIVSWPVQGAEWPKTKSRYFKDSSREQCAPTAHLLMLKIPRAGMRWRCLSNTFLPSPDPDLFLSQLTRVTFFGAKERERDLDKIAGHSSVVRMFDEVCDMIFLGLTDSIDWYIPFTGIPKQSVVEETASNSFI